MVGVSGDAVRNQQLFKKKNNLPFTLLADETGQVAKQFGIPTKAGGTIKKTIDGQEYELKRGVTIPRWTFVIGPDGTIIYRAQVSNNPGLDAERVIAAIKKNKNS